jgi:hypothetical protein
MAEDAEEKSCECGRRERWIELFALDVSLAAKPSYFSIVLGEADLPCHRGPLFFFVCQNGTKKNW